MSSFQNPRILAKYLLIVIILVGLAVIAMETYSMLNSDRPDFRRMLYGERHNFKTGLEYFFIAPLNKPSESHIRAVIDLTSACDIYFTKYEKCKNWGDNVNLTEMVKRGKTKSAEFDTRNHPSLYETSNLCVIVHNKRQKYVDVKLTTIPVKD